MKPNARLSWQYHYRRAEIWKVFKGECGIIRSDTDKENEMKIYNEGDQIKLKVNMERTHIFDRDKRHAIRAA